MNCIKCGADLGENDKFCPNCGTPTSKQNLNNEESVKENAVNNDNDNDNTINDMYTYQRQNDNQNTYQNNYQSGYSNNYQNQNYNYQNKYQGQNPKLGTGLNLAKIIIAIIVAIIAIPLLILIVSLFMYIYNASKAEIVDAEISNTIKNDPNLNTSIISTNTSVNNTTTSNNYTPISNTTPSSFYTPPSKSSAYKVRSSGFNIYIPGDLIYSYNKDDSIMISDTLGTWVINVYIMQVPFQQIKQNRNFLTASYTEQNSDINVSIPQIETVDGVEFVTVEAGLYGENFFMGYAELNSMYTLCFEVFTEDNDIDKDKLKTLSYIVSTAEYTGETSYMNKENKVKMTDVIDKFKSKIDN